MADWPLACGRSLFLDATLLLRDEWGRTAEVRN